MPRKKPAIATPSPAPAPKVQGRAIWKGPITFGMTAIPVKLYSATEEKDIRFRQVHIGPKGEIGQVKQKRVSSIDGSEVQYADILKGYEAEDGQIIVLTDEQMKSLPLATLKKIEVVRFVPRAAVEDVYLNRTYTMTPEPEVVPQYALLVEALSRSGKVGIVKLALRQREHLGMLSVRDGRMSLTTMLWPDEVRVMPQANYPAPKAEEVEIATQLIDALSYETWEPEEFTDNYRAALASLIASVRTNRPLKPVRVVEPEPAVDMMAALRASVEAAKQARLAREKVSA